MTKTRGFVDSDDDSLPRHFLYRCWLLWDQKFFGPRVAGFGGSILRGTTSTYDQ